MISKEQVRDYVVSRFSHLSPVPKEEPRDRDLKKRINKAIAQFNVGEPSGHPTEGKVKAKAGALLSAERRSADVGAGPRKVAG